MNTWQTDGSRAHGSSKETFQRVRPPSRDVDVQGDGHGQVAAILAVADNTFPNSAYLCGPATLKQSAPA